VTAHSSAWAIRRCVINIFRACMQQWYRDTVIGE
jgi:hypothetical protein